MRISRLVTVLVLVGAGLLLAPGAASAQTCIQDVWKAHGNNQNLNCNAKDVTLSSASNINIITGGECKTVNGVKQCFCFANQTVTFTADFQMDLTADTRYDVGFYLATDKDPNGDGAITGQCTAAASLASNTPAGNFINLDAAPDVCGEINGPSGTDHNPLFVTSQVTAQCPATGNLTLPFATTWRQPGSNQVCLGIGNGTTTNDVFPGAPSKCNTGNLVLPITSVTTTLGVEKTALTTSVPETGGDATYQVKVTNTTTIDVTLQSLTDDKYGNITTVHVAGGGFLEVKETTCAVGGVIAANGGTYICTFKGVVPAGDFGGPNFKDTATACADNVTNPTDVCGTDDAEVSYTDVSSAPTLTKTASASCVIDTTYTVVVQNTNGLETLTLSTLTDDVYGNITQQGGAIQSTTCGQAGTGKPGTLPFDIPGGGNYTCAFTARTTNCVQTVEDTVTAGTADADSVPFTPSDNAKVIVNVTTPTP
jgi:hypothetical protein